MRIRALEGGNVIDAHPDAAKVLIENKIYERVSENEPVTNSLTPPVPPPPKPPKAPKESSTAVKPLGTDDMPPQKKRRPAK